MGLHFYCCFASSKSCAASKEYAIQPLDQGSPTQCPRAGPLHQILGPVYKKYLYKFFFYCHGPPLCLGPPQDCLTFPRSPSALCTHTHTRVWEHPGAYVLRCVEHVGILDRDVLSVFHNVSLVHCHRHIHHLASGEWRGYCVFVCGWASDWVGWWVGAIILL